MSTAGGGARAPRVSVCIPTYKGERYLGETLDSVLAQTFEDWEALVVDDCSPDGTLDVAHDYARRDRRVRVIRNADRAGSSPRNANNCVAHAAGEWLKFLFQDDLMAPTCLARMLEAGTHAPLVVAWCRHLYMDGTSDSTRAMYQGMPKLAAVLPGSYASPDAFRAAVLAQRSMNFVGPTSSSMVHRRCFGQYGGFDPELWTSPAIDYWVRVGGVEGLAIVPEPLVTFRVHDDSISGDLRRDRVKQFQMQLHRIRLLYKLCHEPTHAPYRDALPDHPAWPGLREELRTLALDAEWHAVDAKHRERDPALLAEWHRFRDAYPAMRDVLRGIARSRPLGARIRQRVKLAL